MRLPLIGWEEPARLTQAAKDMRAACDELDSNGWIQGRSWSGNGICAGMAMWCAANRERVIRDEQPRIADSRAEDRLFDSRAVIAQAAFQRVTGMQTPVFNDEPGRTVAEVKAKLNEVADEIDKEVAAWAAKQSVS